MLAKRQRIFLVDDDIFCWQLLEHLLRKRGYQHVQAFESGEACLAALHQEPAIIFLDQQIGDMLGTDVFKIIKDTVPSCRVVFVSDQQQVELNMNTLKDGAFDYIVKDERIENRLYTLLASLEQLDVLQAA